jgi:hypothetical protein
MPRWPVASAAQYVHSLLARTSLVDGELRLARTDRSAQRLGIAGQGAGVIPIVASPRAGTLSVPERCSDWLRIRHTTSGGRSMARPRRPHRSKRSSRTAQRVATTARRSAVGRRTGAPPRLFTERDVVLPSCARGGGAHQQGETRPERHRAAHLEGHHAAGALRLLSAAPQTSRRLLPSLTITPSS